MKDRIVAKMKHHRDVTKERIKYSLSYGMTEKLIQKGKLEVWEQAIAIVEEVMRDENLYSK